MLQIVTLAGIGAVGFMLTQNRTRDFTKKETDLMSDYVMYRKDNREAGLSWGTQRTDDHDLNNLNEAYKPRSGPTQAPTHDLDLILSDQADIDAYVNTYAYPFFFMRNGMVPLAASEQGALNVEIPMYGRSFRWDTKNSLAHFPRVYSDKYEPGQNKANSTYAGQRKTMAAEEPEVWEEMYVPREGDNNKVYNPWGPGGAIQMLYNARDEKTTMEKGTDRSRIGLPSKLSRKRYQPNMNNFYPR